MATYTEIFDLNNNSELRNRVQVACIVAAEAIRSEDPATANHADRLIWAKNVFTNPGPESDRMYWALLAKNNDVPLANITGATDAAIQTAVDNAVDLFADGS